MTDDREDRKSSNGGFDLRNEDCPKYRCFIGTVNACCIDQILRNSLQRLPDEKDPQSARHKWNDEGGVGI